MAEFRYNTRVSANFEIVVPTIGVSGKLPNAILLNGDLNYSLLGYPASLLRDAVLPRNSLSAYGGFVYLSQSSTDTSTPLNQLIHGGILLSQMSTLKLGVRGVRRFNDHWAVRADVALIPNFPWTGNQFSLNEGFSIGPEYKTGELEMAIVYSKVNYEVNYSDPLLGGDLTAQFQGFEFKFVVEL